MSTEIKRKPITTQTNRRNADNHPEFLDTEALLERFSPLIKSIHKRFMAYNGVFLHSEDTYDLYNQIVLEFLRLRKNFDPKRGIDFTGFMKFHLQNRVYHWVMKMQKVSQIMEIRLFPLQQRKKMEKERDLTREIALPPVIRIKQAIMVQHGR